MSRRLRMVLAVIAAGCAWPAKAESERTPLAPYQMVRSLQVLQDRVADGDHAALPMQNKLLELIDKRFQVATDDEFDDRRNFRALLIYGMSGGNPLTLETLFKRLPLDPTDQRLMAGVYAYSTGKLRTAQGALKPFDATKLRPELGAFLSLVQGSLIARDAPADALTLLDHARLLGPGTLVEEAALRRSMELTARLKNGERFQRATEQYVRRFIRSPYASQFVDSLISGLIALDGKIDLDAIAATLTMMTPEQQRFVYLKLARISAIDNLDALNNFATTHAEAVVNADGGIDPRTVLYGNVGSVTSETVDDVLARLKSIDQSRLSPNDRLLLQAAEAVADSITTEPSSASASASAETAKPEPAARQDTAAHVLASDAPLPPAPQNTNDDRNAWLSDARAKLDAVDAMLEENTQ